MRLLFIVLTIIACLLASTQAADEISAPEVTTRPLNASENKGRFLRVDKTLGTDEEENLHVEQTRGGVGEDAVFLTMAFTQFRRGRRYEDVGSIRKMDSRQGPQAHAQRQIHHSVSKSTCTLSHSGPMHSKDVTAALTAMESSLQKAWRAAAEKLATADFLLIATGAGFSADSSLPVYADIAKVDAYEKINVEYQDLCDPYMLEQDEEVFYGFWGSCTNSYRDTKHHRGYQILLKWRDAIRGKSTSNSADEKKSRFQVAFERLKKCEALPAGVTTDSVTTDPFFVYTSNVDSHFKRDFDSKEVYELHGSVETWQCAGDVETGAREPCEKIWKLPADFRFDLDEATMKAPGAEATTCPECGGKGRPNVLMFHDRQWIANKSEENGYIAWESVMELMLQEDPTLNLVVLEIGCGTRVPSVRRETEMVVADVIEGCGRPQATLIRVNPEIPTCDNPLILATDRFLPIQSRGLEALEGIDRVLTNLRQRT